MDVNVAALYFNERMGRWAWSARPIKGGTRFERLALDLKGLRLDGRLDWQGSGLQARSRYRGRLQGDGQPERCAAGLGLSRRA